MGRGHCTSTCNNFAILNFLECEGGDRTLWSLLRKACFKGHQWRAGNKLSWRNTSSNKSSHFRSRVLPIKSWNKNLKINSWRPRSTIEVFSIWRRSVRYLGTRDKFLSVSLPVYSELNSPKFPGKLRCHTLQRKCRLRSLNLKWAWGWCKASVRQRISTYKFKDIRHIRSQLAQICKFEIQTVAFPFANSQFSVAMVTWSLTCVFGWYAASASLIWWTSEHVIPPTMYSTNNGWSSGRGLLTFINKLDD